MGKVRLASRYFRCASDVDFRDEGKVANALFNRIELAIVEIIVELIGLFLNTSGECVSLRSAVVLLEF